ncbi:hypothetical protein OPQ81_005141 [Rhizoctonia solani]|nr:hypothetical protein OPQ81_005141 [Rhizoctonia solani]
MEKPSGIYTVAIQFDKIEELQKEHEKSCINVVSIQWFRSPSLTEIPLEDPTVVANKELLCITSEESEKYRIKYKEIAQRVCDNYPEQVGYRAHAASENNPMVVLEELDKDSPKSPKVEALMIQLNAAKLDKGKACGQKAKNIKHNASKPKDVT